MSETKSLMEGIKKAFADHQEISQKNYDELKSNGVQYGESIEKLQNCINDIDVKHQAFEKAMARQSQALEAKADKELDLKHYNEMLVKHGGQALELEQLDEVKSAYDKFVRVGERRMTSDEIKSLNTIVDPNGGFFVVPQYSQRMTEKGFDNRGFMSAVDRVTSSSGQYKEIIDWADYDLAYYKNELTEASADAGGEAFKEVTWNATEQIYTKKFSRNQLEDSMIDIESYILRKLREGSDRQTGDRIVSGTGVDQPRGILTYANGTAYGQIEQITSSAVNSLKWADVINLLPSALKDPYHDNSSYCMRRTAFFDLLADVDGNARFQIGNQINFFSGDKMSLAILGSPVVWDPNMEAVATNGKSVLFGDFKETYVYMDRMGFSVLRDETNPSYVKVHLRRRNDGKVRNFEASKILVIQ